VLERALVVEVAEDVGRVGDLLEEVRLDREHVERARAGEAHREEHLVDRCR
jgi:hypothetical protein